MGYRTPNIDRIADEGMRFTDSYGEQSCTAGPLVVHHRPERVPHRPEQGRRARAPTSACRPRTRRSRSCSSRSATRPGSSARTTSATGTSSCRRCTASTSSSATSTTSTPRRSRSIPNYPPAEDFPNFNERFGPRGVLHCWATDEDDRHERPALGPRRQAADRGHRAADQEADGDERRRVRRRARSTSSSRQSSRRHAVLLLGQHDAHALPHAHQAARASGQAGRWQSPYHDTMIDHDKHVGELLDLLDELGIADDTIVIY